MLLQNAKVEAQNSTLVVKNPETGGCVTTELDAGDPHAPGSGETDSMVSVFGSEAFDQPEKHLQLTISHLEHAARWDREERGETPTHAPRDFVTDGGVDQDDGEAERFFNVQLCVTNGRTGVSQVHDVLVLSGDGEEAERKAEEKVLSDSEDSFETVEVSDLGGAGDA